MEMKNEYRVTWRLTLTWLWESICKPPKCLFPVIWILIGIWSVAGMLFLESIPLAILFALFCIYRAFFRDLLFSRKQYKALARTYGEENWLRTISFQEDRLVTTEGNVFSLQLPYSDITSIKENGNEVCLMLKNKSALRLYKDKFVGGSWEECRAFIAEKMSS